jgi:pimeloyl-ACP methyl ester carboxylesterase
MARRHAGVVAASSQFSIALVWSLIRGVLILVAVLLVVLVLMAGALTHHVITAHNDAEPVNPSTYLLNSYVPLNFADGDGVEHEGWLLLGLRKAPTIILSHGYNSNRSDLLALGTILRENHFNVYIFNYAGAKGKDRASDFGDRQVAILLDAIRTVTKQHGVNPGRVGLFGVSAGGYASLVAAEQIPAVKALVVDTLYEDPLQMFDAELDALLGGSSPVFRFIAGKEFHLFDARSKPYPLREALPKLGGLPKLFISGKDMPALANVTEDLYSRAPQPKRLLVLEHSQPTLAYGAEKKEYENQVLSFFLENLSLRAD